MHLAAVIPTFNERASIGDVLDRLVRLRRPDLRISILVVDDHSPDGLGDAYARGLTYALEHLPVDAVLQMDADLSHLPEDLPRLVGALHAGAELAIGSRYIGGNRAARGLGPLRRSLSWGGNHVARHWLGLGLRPIRDCTAGFRLWRTATLRAARPASVRARGYGYQVALLARAAHAGARIVEVPVEFPARQAGRSKFGADDVLEFAGWVLRARHGHAR